MNRTIIKCFLAVSIGFVVMLSGKSVLAQTPNPWGYTTGYGNVYGSFGLASTMQSMYNVAKSQSLKSSATKAATAGRPKSQTAAAPARVVRKSGIFRPDPSIDTGKALADALGSTPDEKDLIRKIYTGTKAAYEEQTDARGWGNNIAGGLTFFTIVAATVYHNAEQPGDDAVAAYYGTIDASLDEMPGLASLPDKDKQNFNNMLIGFGGILLAGQIEGKQTGNRATIENYRKLAGMLITMVLKTEPDNLRIENGQIVLK